MGVGGKQSGSLVDTMRKLRCGGRENGVTSFPSGNKGAQQKRDNGRCALDKF